MPGHKREAGHTQILAPQFRFASVRLRYAKSDLSIRAKIRLTTFPSHAVPSSLAVARILPSGLNATFLTSPPTDYEAK